MLRTQLAKAQHDVCLLRAENATLNERALEVEEVKAKLQAAQEQLDSQTKQINRHLQTIKNANERYAELVESKTVLDCLLHSQQKEKESKMFCCFFKLRLGASAHLKTLVCLLF